MNNRYDLNKKSITISLAVMALMLVLFLIIPWYQLSQYDYSNVGPANPLPKHIITFVSPLSFTMNKHIPLALLAVVFCTADILMLMSDFYIIDLKHKRIVRLTSFILFLVCIVLTIISWIVMINMA